MLFRFLIYRQHAVPISPGSVSTERMVVGKRRFQGTLGWMVILWIFGAYFGWTKRLVIRRFGMFEITLKNTKMFVGIVGIENSRMMKNYLIFVFGRWLCEVSFHSLRSCVILCSFPNKFSNAKRGDGRWSSACSNCSRIPLEICQDLCHLKNHVFKKKLPQLKNCIRYFWISQYL